MVSTAAGTLAVARAALAAAAPLSGLLVLNSRHLAPSTIIIFDTAILGFLAAMRGLEKRMVRSAASSRRYCNTSLQVAGQNNQKQKNEQE